VVWISVNGEASISIRAAKEKVLALIRDVPVCGVLFPGVDAIADRGERRYQYTLATRQTLGSSFTGHYLAQYEEQGDRISWRTLEGNLKSSGTWHVGGVDGAVQLRLTVSTELEAPVPRILKKPAEIFAERETSQGIEKQLREIKKRLEG
jgi:uncharacterized membrane protein